MQRQMALGAAQAALLPSLAWLTLSQVHPRASLTLSQRQRLSLRLSLTLSLSLSLSLTLTLTLTRCTVAPPYLALTLTLTLTPTLTPTPTLAPNPNQVHRGATLLGVALRAGRDRRELRQLELQAVAVLQRQFRLMVFRKRFHNLRRLLNTLRRLVWYWKFKRRIRQKTAAEP